MATIPAQRSAALAGPEEKGRPASIPIDASQEVPWPVKTLLGLFLMVLGLVLLYFMIALWPAVQSAATNAEKKKAITWFGWSYAPTPDTALLILVILVSALGSYVHATVSFTDYVGNRQLARSWIWWYLLRLFVGTSLAVLFYFAIRGGFFGGGANSTDINPYGIAALAGLVGLFSKQATDKLRELFDTAFRVAPGYGDDARGDSIVNPAPTLEASEPQRLRAGEVELVLVGSGFTTGSSVRVAQPGGPDVPRKVSFLGPQRLGVTLEADDVAAPGLLLFTVVNPEPGGGMSQSIPVSIDEADEARDRAAVGTPTAGEANGAEGN